MAVLVQHTGYGGILRWPSTLCTPEEAKLHRRNKVYISSHLFVLLHFHSILPTFSTHRVCMNFNNALKFQEGHSNSLKERQKVHVAREGHFAGRGLSLDRD